MLPPARPSSPRNCTAKRLLRNNEPHLSVRCVAGYDGGLNQHFTLDILGENGRVLANTTANFVGKLPWQRCSTYSIDTPNLSSNSIDYHCLAYLINTLISEPQVYWKTNNVVLQYLWQDVNRASCCRISLQALPSIKRHLFHKNSPIIQTSRQHFCELQIQ